jgi:hypothetical protein
MPHNFELSTFKLFFAFLCLFACHCFADLTYSLPSDSCTTGSVLGQATFCCDGGCYDGTTIFNKDGLCGHFDDSCNDPENPPSCNSNQVYASSAAPWVDAGIGLCYIPITG